MIGIGSLVPLGGYAAPVNLAVSFARSLITAEKKIIKKIEIIKMDNRRTKKREKMNRRRERDKKKRWGGGKMVVNATGVTLIGVFLRAEKVIYKRWRGAANALCT